MSGVARVRAARSVARSLGSAHSRRGGGSRSGRSFAVTLLTPVRAGAEGELSAYLNGLGVGDESPLAKLPYVHFARWEENLGRVNRAGMRGHFWSPSYFAESCGGAPLAIVTNYIAQQKRPD